ncbi:thioredoxin family protein [Pleionea mediterranea]|uniref:AhpC/TSA family protein n=1 Tax=Pleionea mediterranea TaxID=523701 RepID=A0A316FFP3_9GAMM|nr:thioredoxin family protein [Pleionea mediterranea]PWK46882.1 AhpC/TSA family protein [Pleionea mediterranea]
MAKRQTPICDFGWKAVDFDLLGVDGKRWSLDKCRGAMGLLVMFICNHCPYVKAIRSSLIKDVKALNRMGVGVVAINSNDPSRYPEDSFPYMKSVSNQFNYNFPYLLDDNQAVAKEYKAICTPDFFGFNASMELQYRGRLDNTGAREKSDAPRELVLAMRQVALTGQGPRQQNPSIGCSIKWADGSQQQTA